MEVIKDMFPHMSQDVLQGVLEECGGNVERGKKKRGKGERRRDNEYVIHIYIKINIMNI